MKNLKVILIGIAIFIVSLLFAFIGGCQRGKKLAKPDIVNSTIFITDPYWHRIADSLKNLPPAEKIKWLPSKVIEVPDQKWMDSVLLANKADSMAIFWAVFKNYYSVFTYHWDNKDKIIEGIEDTLAVSLETTVTQNQIIKYDLKYKFLVPFTTNNTTVDNSVHYNSYTYFGISAPIYARKLVDSKNIDYLGLEVVQSLPKWYFRVNYQPYAETFTVAAGLRVLKFK